jgi:mono/diheme cytochrome c family protein
VVRWLALALLLVACRSQPRFAEPLALAEGKVVPADTLNDGHDAYMQYCYACHGEKGDGRGPAAPGMRPPPRDFTVGMFKFGGVAAGSLPQDEDLVALVRNGLEGTPMLPWDIPDRQRMAIVQYLKTFSPRWKEEPPGDRIVPEVPDPWVGPGKEAQALEIGRRLYHLQGVEKDPKTEQFVRAYPGCNACHPSYLPRGELAELGLKTFGKAPELRPDLYEPGADKKSDYLVDGRQILLLPIDFLFQRIKNGSSPGALWRTIICGIAGTAMPSFKGLMKDEDLWALSHYVKSLADLRGTPGAEALHARLTGDK